MTTNTMKRAVGRIVLAASLLAVLFIHLGPGDAGRARPELRNGRESDDHDRHGYDYANALVLAAGRQARRRRLQLQGSTLGDFALARYNPNGSLDTSFNGTGKVTTAIGPAGTPPPRSCGSRTASSLPPASATTAQTTTSRSPATTPNGSLDTSFNGTGKVTTAIGSGNDRGLALALQPDGKLVVAGRSNNGSR